MRKGLKFWVLVMFLPSILAGCASLVSPSSKIFSANVASKYDVFVASMRGRNADGKFNLQRSDRVSYAVASVSVPHKRKKGTITSQSNQTVVSRHFIDHGVSDFNSSKAFANAVARDAARKSKHPEVVIFVHGFNTNFDESLFRLTQIGHDFDLPSTQVLYSWPSAFQISQYIHDLDSVLLARNGLEELIQTLSNSGVERIVLAGHSMGAPLIMETLRQMHLRSGRRSWRKIDGVVFFSPDMDAEVFVQTATQIAPLPDNFVIYSSTNDSLLKRFSKYLTFGQDRLGGIEDLERLKYLNLTLVDVAQTETDEKSTHSSLISSPELIDEVNKMKVPGLARFGIAAAQGLIPGSKITKLDHMTAVILPPLP